MEKWAFVSDFDGTISKKDYFWLVIEKYFPEGRKLYEQWQNGEILDIDFLKAIFTSIHHEEEQIINDILTLPIDENVPSFIKKVQQRGGDFYILSAGSNYYIDHILKHYHIEGVTVFSNEGRFHKNNLHVDIDKSIWHYSERYGIDKSKVIQKLKEEYKVVFFAGDSEPDSHPAVYADTTFAKSKLIDILKERNIPFEAYDSFKDIENYLHIKGVL